MIVPVVGPPELPPPGAPGPFAFADADRLRALLVEAEWTEVALEDVQCDVWVGGATTAAESVAFTTSDTFGQMLLAKATDDQRAEALTRLEEAYEQRVVDGRLRLGAAAWLVTARNLSARRRGGSARPFRALDCDDDEVPPAHVNTTLDRGGQCAFSIGVVGTGRHAA